MIEEVINNAYSVGGFGLALMTVIIYGVRWIYKQFKDLNKSLLDVKEQLSSLRVEQEKYITAIKMCDSPECKVKKALGLDKTL